MKAGLKLIYWFAVVLCFCGIPLFIGMWGVERVIFYKHENRKNQIFAAGRKTLESWKSISSDKDVYFRICSGIFSRIQTSENPSNEFQSGFSRIPEKFRRKMKVEAWDIEGNPLWMGDELKGNRFVSRRTLESLQKVLTLSPAFSLQGEVFWQEDAISELAGPILGQTAERFITNSIPVLVVSGRTLKLDWYQVYVSEKFIMRCVIPKEADDQGDLFQRLVDRFNLRKAGKAFLGIFSSVPAGKNLAIRANFGNGAIHGGQFMFPSTRLMTIPETELSLAIGGVKTGLETQFETPSSLVVFSPAGNKLRLALIFPREKVMENLDYLRNVVFRALMVSLGMVAIFCFLIIVPDRPLYFSIKWKLGLIFLFSNAIPLVVLGLLANDFLFQKRLTMLNEAYSHAEKILRSVDNRFYMEVALPESFLDRYCKTLGKKIPKRKFECYDTLEKFRWTLKKFPIIYYTLIKNDGKFFLSPYIIRPHGTALDEIFKDPMVTQNDKLNEAQFFSALGEKAFEEMNFESQQGREKRSETNAKLAVLESLAEKNLGRSLEEILNEGFVGLGKIQNIGLLGELWAFWNFILNPQSGKKEFLLYAVFIQRKINSIKRNITFHS